MKNIEPHANGTSTPSLKAEAIPAASDASAIDEPSADILTVQGLVIPTGHSQPVTLGMIDASPLGICLATGGGLYEGLTLDHDGGMIWLNMYGKSKNLAENVRATRLAEHFRPGRLHRLHRRPRHCRWH